LFDLLKLLAFQIGKEVAINELAGTLGIDAAMYFWRTYQQQEIDLIEEREGRLFAYECKWTGKKKVRLPTAWAQAYPEASFTVITPDNYQEFFLPYRTIKVTSFLNF